MAATIYLSDGSTWTVSGTAFRLLLDTARSANADPSSRFPAMVELFDVLQWIRLDQLDDATRADVVKALLAGIASIQQRLKSDSGELVQVRSNDGFREVYADLDRMLRAMDPG